MSQSPIIKRSIVIAGKKTSVSLEEPYWKGLQAIAKRKQTTLGDLVATIKSDLGGHNLSSAIRLFVLADAQAEGSKPRLPGDLVREVAAAGN
jgi:predicted DNA-binding ribbon-helix-helix protein